MRECEEDFHGEMREIFTIENVISLENNSYPCTIRLPLIQSTNQKCGIQMIGIDESMVEK